MTLVAKDDVPSTLRTMYFLIKVLHNHGTTPNIKYVLNIINETKKLYKLYDISKISTFSNEALALNALMLGDSQFTDLILGIDTEDDIAENSFNIMKKLNKNLECRHFEEKIT